MNAIDAAGERKYADLKTASLFMVCIFPRIAFSPTMTWILQKPRRIADNLRQADTGAGAMAWSSSFRIKPFLLVKYIFVNFSKPSPPGTLMHSIADFFRSFPAEPSSPSSRHRFIAKVLAIGCCLLMMPGIDTHAKENAPVNPRAEKFFRTHQFGRAVLSPDQQYLAVTTSIKGRLHLATVDIETRKVTPLAGFDDADVWSVQWISNNRLIFDLVDRESEDSMAAGNGLYAVNRDGTDAMELAAPYRYQLNRLRIGSANSADFKWEFKFLDYVDTLNDGVHIIVGETVAGNRNETNLYRLNTLNNRKYLISNSAEGDPSEFVTDNNHDLRVVVARKSRDRKNIIWYRDNPSSPWKLIDEGTTIEPGFHILGFDADNKTLYVSARKDRDTSGIYKFDFAANDVGEEVLTAPDVDVRGGLVFDGKTNKLQGIRMNTEPPRTHWLDKDFEATQKIIDAALPDHINELSGDPKVRVLVYSYSSTDPGVYFLYEPGRKKLEPLFRTAKWVEPEKMSEKLIFDYQARDGLHIPSYLTLPKGKPEKSLPLVVLVHGGPFTRDYWSFDPEVQFLADLGYAVLQPQYRGSMGFGSKHFESGFKQWGLKMQDDVTDGVKNLVSQGIVDPKRVCIMGASYGGYAALMGVIREPDMFRCAVDLMGVTNISYLYKYGRWYRSDYFKYASGVHVGDPEADRAQFDATSPELLADKIRVPVFMVYNEQDTRVPMIHGERMRDALKAKGKVFEWMQFADEEHGFSREENRYKVYDAIEKFLTRYNPAD